MFIGEIISGMRLHVAETRYSANNKISHFPTSFHLNCSGLMNYALENQFPPARDEIIQYIKATEKDNGKPDVTPFCLHYYKFMQNNQPKRYWQTVHSSKELSCGDFIIICEDDTKITRRGQHMMMIASEILVQDSTWASCKVFDSVRYGHSLDQRSPDGANGVGEGQIALRIEADKVVEIKWGLSEQSTKYSKFAIARVKNSFA